MTKNTSAPSGRSLRAAGMVRTEDTLKQRTLLDLRIPSIYLRCGIAQETKRTPRLGEERTLEEFKNIMANLNLSYPKFIDCAVPGTKQCGVCPCDPPSILEKYCQHMTEGPQS
jgi:hypothetical protein